MGVGEKELSIDTADPVAGENGHNGEIGMNAVASSSSSSVVKHGKGKDQEGDTEKSEKKNETTNTVPFYKLFSFADSTDIFLMIAGTIGAVANGISMPLMTILFGDMIQSFGGTTDIHDVVHEVSKVCLSIKLETRQSSFSGHFQCPS